MANWKTVCDLASALPDAELGSLHGAPCWRVRGKVLVQLGPRLRVPGEDEIVERNGELVMVATSHDEREALLREDDVDALKSAPTRVVSAAGETSGEQAACRAAIALAERLGIDATYLPGAHGGWGSDPQEFADKLDEVLRTG